MNYKIIVVNLEKRPDRRAEVSKTFSNFEPYSFYNAIDGKSIDTTYEIKSLFDGNDFGSRKGFIGCALSHYNIWIDLAKDEQNDYYVIFEDDFTLSDDFATNFNKTKEYLNTNANIDILFLGYHKYNELPIPEQFSINNFNNNKNYVGGTFSYIITKKGARNAIDYAHKTGIKHGIDYFMKIIPDLNIFETSPHIVYSEWVRSKNDNVDTDIQKDYECFDFTSIYDYNNFLFIKGYDIINYDYKYINTRNVNELLTHARTNDEHISAFNTLGFCKKHGFDIESLQKSDWFKDNDGLFINLDKKLRVKVLCNWCDSKKLCDEWNHMSNTRNNIKLTDEDDNIDYYIIINKPMNDKYIPEKTIVFQMEPWCYNEDQNWGVKTWGEWAQPDESKFLHVRSHKKFYNNCTWNIKIPDGNITKNMHNNTLSTICSSKYFDSGHIKRIDFLKMIESKNEITLDIYGMDNKHNFKNYKGCLSDELKHNGVVPYKYYFMVENNQEHNYITEKLWEPIVGECLCFYWGAPNVSDYINPLAYVQLDLNNFDASYKLIHDAIANDLWSKRIDVIRQEKYKVLNYYNFYPTVERIITNDLHKGTVNLKIYIMQKSNELNYKIIPFIETVKEFGFEVIIRKYDNEYEYDYEFIEGCDNEKRIINKSMTMIKYCNIDKCSNVGYILSHIKLYEDLLNDIDQSLVLDDDMILQTSYNNFLNHIKYLPENYDICLLNSSARIIKQVNPLYYNIKNYFFDSGCAYFISKNGVTKLLKNINNYISCDFDRLFYNALEDLNCYSVKNNLYSS